jgi:hypothetical protein
MATGQRGGPWGRPVPANHARAPEARRGTCNDCDVGDLIAATVMLRWRLWISAPCAKFVSSDRVRAHSTPVATHVR